LFEVAHHFSALFLYRDIAESSDVDIENQMNVTVVFPDSSLPEPTDGGFSNQEEFRQFVTKNQKRAQWDSALHSRPLNERLFDYKDETLAMAFPLQFPYGHTGLPDDPAVKKLGAKNGWKKHMKRNREDALRGLLQHRKPEFHTALFNLIVQSTLMKAMVFHSTKIYCNATNTDGTKMSER